MSLVWFLGFLAVLVAVASLVKKITGAKTYLVETFPLEPGERVLWEDGAADAYPIPNQQAAYVSFRRLQRVHVKVTNLRVVCGMKGLFGSSHVVQHVLYPSDRAYPEQARALGGGLLTVGYQVFVFERASLVVHGEGKRAYVELTLDPSLDSSRNLRAFRVCTERAASFTLPE